MYPYSDPFYSDPPTLEDNLETPVTIESHAVNYTRDAWQQYSLQELGMWVHLLVQRAQMRSVKGKFEKDLYDAQNYLNMMQEHIKAAKNMFFGK